MTKKQKTISALAAIGVIGVTALGMSATSVFAAEGSMPGPNDLIQSISERFGLNEDEVREVFEEHRETQHEQMKLNHQEHLDELVADGTLTQEQADALTQKHEEMREQMESLKDLPEEERREAMEQQHEEMKAWAEEQGISLEEGFGHGKGHPFARHMIKHRLEQ